jgi:superfamily II DNA or RNA helicase
VIRSGGDTIVFSTIQSSAKSVDDTLGYDLIIIDEADNSIRGEWENLATLEYIAQIPGSLGVRPHIIPMSGTPDRESLDIFGAPVYSYSMDEFLMSPWAPQINYHLMTNPAVSDTELVGLMQEIRSIQDMEYGTKKKTCLAQFRSKLDDILLRFSGYDTLAKHMNEKIDLGEKTLIFVPKIEDAKRLKESLAPLLADRGISVVDIHSESDESDRSIIEAFRDDDHPLQILIAVDKLNRSIDVPDCHNIIFLRNTNSRKIFIQQLARWLRGDQTQIYDYVMNLSNIAYLHDIQDRISKWGYTTHGTPNTESKITLFLRKRPMYEGDGDVSESMRSIDFYDICGLYLSERSKIELSSLWTTQETILSTLKAHNIENYTDLRNFGPGKFTQIFGVSDLGKFLGITLTKINLDTLYELSKKLGWEVPAVKPSEEKEKISLWTTQETILSTLKAHNIENYTDLRNFGPVKFKQTFGVSDLGQFLQKRIVFILQYTLYELSKKLGWEVPAVKPSEEKEKISLWTTQETILSTLKAHNIENYTDLRNFGPVKFKQTFGKSDLGKFLGITLTKINLDTLYELSKKLRWEVPAVKPSEEKSLWTTQETILSTLKAHNIENYTDLRNFGPVKFTQTFGASDLGKFLGITLTKINLDTLYELSKKLRWEVPAVRPSEEKSLWTTQETILSTLKAHNIENYTDLRNFGPVKFTQTFGASDLGKFLGITLARITLDTLYELSKKLRWEVPAVRPSEEKSLWTTQETILSTLKAHNIENYTDLRNFGPGKFKQTFGKSDLGKFLGITLARITLDTLYELSKKLRWEVPAVRPSEEKSLWTTQETILSTLKAHNIENYTDLRNFGPVKFKQTFGTSDLGTFFGTTFRTLTLDNLYDLAKKLGWEVPEIKPSEERKKK